MRPMPLRVHLFSFNSVLIICVCVSCFALTADQTKRTTSKCLPISRDSDLYSPEKMGNTFAKPEDVPIKWYTDYVAAMPSQQGRNVAITGCTSGTGLEAAKAIVTRGGHALALNRPSERAKAAVATIKEAVKDGGKVTHVDCDLQDFASVRTAAAQIQKLVGTDGLHCLLNNAGVYPGLCPLFVSALKSHTACLFAVGNLRALSSFE